MTDWFEMGGYGQYVWGSMIVVLLCVVIEMIGLRLRWKSISVKN